MVSPEAVAVATLSGIQAGACSMSVGFDGWMLAQLTSGMGPAGTLANAAVQVLTMGLWRAIALCYVQFWHAGVIAVHDKGETLH